MNLPGALKAQFDRLGWPWVLASQSPRRRELLAASGVSFDIDPPRQEEDAHCRAGELPYLFVARLAYAKAAEIRPRHPAALVIACDTLAVCGGEILGKPCDLADARRMLRRLAGTQHVVQSGVCLWAPGGRQPVTRVATTWLEMDALGPEQLESYLATDQWQGKAGAFGYQDRLGWVRVVAGSESNVVGLPLEMLLEMLARL